MRRIFFTLSLFICIYSHSQNKQALLKSDSLFAKGVELYNQKDYKAAIPLFTESDKIDKAELDSTSNRREYSAMWLGSCYYKLGEIQTAQKHYQYYTIIPVDRRLTVLSDSLSAIGEKFLSEGNLEAGISAIKECGKSEKECIGENHPFYGNTLTNLLPLFCITENIKEATTCIKEIVPIYLKNPEWGKKIANNIIPFVLAVRNKINFDDIKDIIEINDAAALFAEPSMNAPFSSANDSIYGLIIQAGINLLTNTNDINGAIEFGEEALKKISGLNRKGNANEYIIATSLATLYAGNILIPQPYEVRKKGLALYQRALDIALENYGEYSVETATIYLKLGNYYMRMEEERSFDKAKHWLHKAFNSRLIDSLSTNKYQTKQLIEIFASSYPLFSILNDEEYFLQTAKKITQTNSFSFCENHLLMESMAEAYKAYNIGKYDKAISIYQQLINCCPEKQSKQCLSYIKSKAFTEYLNQEYDKAIADYLSIKDIMADKTVEPSISAYAQMLDLLSNCYQTYICKEKAEPVLPARTRTVSKPFSYSGTVRYINLPTSSYMSYITEAINKWGKCRTGAITMYGAGVGVYGNSGYAYTGSTPSKLKKRIEEANSSNAEITDINITENGNYVIILGGSGYWTLGYPDAFLKKLEQYRTGDLRDDQILSACFNDKGEWVVITDKHYSYSNETIKNFILKAEELYGEVCYAYITNYGMIACCKNGVYYKNIPSNLAEALKKLTFKPKVIKFTDNGLYLITDGESQNYYFM